MQTFRKRDAHCRARFRPGWDQTRGAWETHWRGVTTYFVEPRSSCLSSPANRSMYADTRKGSLFLYMPDAFRNQSFDSVFGPNLRNMMDASRIMWFSWAVLRCCRACGSSSPPSPSSQTSPLHFVLSLIGTRLLFSVPGHIPSMERYSCHPHRWLWMLITKNNDRCRQQWLIKRMSGLCTTPLAKGL